MNSSDPNGDDNTLLGLERVPEIFVEGYRGAMTRAGMIKLNFFTTRLDPVTGAIEKHAAMTLAMPTPDFAEVATALHALLQDLQARGVIGKED